MCNNELPAIIYPLLWCEAHCVSQGSTGIWLLQFVTKRSFSSTAIHTIITFFTIECYEGQTEWGIQGELNILVLPSSWNVLRYMVLNLMGFFQCNVPTKLLITKLTVCAGCCCSTDHGFSSLLFLGNGCFSTLHTHSSNHIKVNVQGKVTLSPVELLPGYCHLLKFLSKSNLPVMSVMATGLQWVHHLCDLTERWLSPWSGSGFLASPTINYRVVLHKALLVLKFLFIRRRKEWQKNY